MKLYAYVRVSTRQQSLKRQIENIMSADGGAYAGATFFSDKFTGSTLDPSGTGCTSGSSRGTPLCSTPYPA